MENKQLTLRQVIALTRDDLGNIEVPARQRTIAESIYRAMSNLSAILEAMDREDAARQEAKQETTGEE